MWEVVAIMVGGLVFAAVMSLLYALMLMGGHCAEDEREEYRHQTGRWPEW